MELGALAEAVRPVALAREQRLTVLSPLEPLLSGGGLRRGSLVGVQGPTATSLALALAAGASQSGSWVAAVGLPSLGLAAADGLGVALERLVLVAAPPSKSWATVVASLVDGFDIVLVRASRSLRAADSRRLTARARERGTVLIALGGSPAGSDAPDVSFEVVRSRWEGLGDGHGHLRARRVTVEVSGRREAARHRRVDLWLPASGGGVDVVLADPVPIRRKAEG